MAANNRSVIDQQNLDQMIRNMYYSRDGKNGYATYYSFNMEVTFPEFSNRNTNVLVDCSDEVLRQRVLAIDENELSPSSEIVKLEEDVVGEAIVSVGRKRELLENLEEELIAYKARCNRLHVRIDDRIIIVNAARAAEQARSRQQAEPLDLSRNNRQEVLPEQQFGQPVVRLRRFDQDRPEIVIPRCDAPRRQPQPDPQPPVIPPVEVAMAEQQQVDMELQHNADPEIDIVENEEVVMEIEDSIHSSESTDTETGMQKHSERVRRPSPEHLEPIESTSMVKRKKEVSTIVKLKNEAYGLETTIASCSSFRCFTNLESLPKNAKTSMFVVLSLLYGKLVIVACIAFVVSNEISSKSLPKQYYEGFFTVLYGVSIVFLLYLFCFLLQDSSCCPGGGKKEKKAKPVKSAPKKKEKGKKESSAESGATSQGSRSRPNVLQREVYPRKIKDKAKSKDDSERVECSADSTDAEEVTSLVGIGSGKKGKNPSEEKLTEPSPDSIDIEASSSDGEYRRRKTSQNLTHYGSFFLRIGAIAFGLGTMIYIGLQFGKIFEIPMNSPCYELLQFLNPILQMVFTFMQMYFIFMNARLKIHRFKFIARFGLMHVMATNLCVWIKTLVYESLYALSRESVSYFNFSIVKKIADEVNTIGGKSALPVSGYNTPRSPNRALSQIIETEPSGPKSYFDHLGAASQQISYALLEATTSTIPSTTSSTTTSTTTSLPSTTSPTTAALTSTLASTISSTLTPLVSKTSSILNATQEALVENVTVSLSNSLPAVPSTNASANLLANKTSIFDAVAAAWYNPPANLTGAYRNDSCGRLNIMGNIVQDAAPFLYPFVIEYSLIGAAVIFVMWRHIGRSPRYVSEENIEHKLEAILSQRAVAIAQAQNGSRVDCIGASKGLFFGLLLLVGSLICMLLFFVLIHHEQFSWLAVYLADASHSMVMALSILAIIIGFCRAKNLKFYAADTTDLNDILLRVSAFGLFVYALFSIIAGARYALVKEQNLLVLVTGAITVFQVVLQLLFIGDMSKRHVYLPEHDRNKPGRQIVTFLLICNITMWILFTFESQKVLANPVQLEFFGQTAWKLVEHLTLPLCIFHRFHSAVALAEIWKNSYKPRIG